MNAPIPMPDPSLTVKLLDSAAAGRWDAFVAACPQATFFHRAGWKEVLERAFGHRAYFLYAERAGVVEGVLPLGHVRSRLFGHYLSSTPFCVIGGVAAATPAATSALEEKAEALARELGVDYLEYRNQVPCHPKWPCKDNLYVNFRKEIHPDPEVNLAAIPRKQRAMVRKGIDAGLRSTIDEGVGRFYDAYSRSVHKLGTPVFAKRYFEILREVFREDCEILTVSLDEQVISSVLSFYFRDEVLPYYGGGGEAAREVKGNDFMYWELMRRAAERGIRTFDYGRSKVGTGSYSFTTNWGFQPKPLDYEYRLIRAGAVPDLNPLNPKYRLFINLWKRLPLRLTRLIGPHLVKNLG